MITADVLFMADHFVMVTTVQTDYSPDTRDVESAAWRRLGEEYGIDWVAMTKPFINQVSIEVLQEAPTVPPIGDLSDAGVEEEPED